VLTIYNSQFLNLIYLAHFSKSSPSLAGVHSELLSQGHDSQIYLDSFQTYDNLLTVD